ncbi:uncharacterized protein LOC131961946, partial [Centropristis striata]|uniref:uncharacterized protein LOC131961946 n=1 Tax=Centropristis striata TaxID=184440 RepID=UPI0027E0F3E8
MMFWHTVFVVSLVTFLRDFHVSSCDYECTDRPEFTPSRLVVKFGDPASVSCSVCQHDCLNNTFDIECPVGVKKQTGTTVSWTIDSLTEWSIVPTCWHTNDTGYQCCTTLPVTIYQHPRQVSISFVNHTGPMFEGGDYDLQCSVQDVAPVGDLNVTFYKGQTALGQQQANNNTEKKPVNETFTMSISMTNEDDGAQFWCEAKLELGPEGPQPPPVMSQSITATVYYKPQLKESAHPDPIIVTEGNPLQLNCSAMANPSPSYTWTLPSAPARTSPSNSSVHTVVSVTPADGGQYSCSVSNNMGRITVKFNVVVKGLEPTSTKPPPITTITPTTTSTTTIATATTLTNLLCFMLLFSALPLQASSFSFPTCPPDPLRLNYECTDRPEFTPSRLVVKLGDPASVSCSVCQHDCLNNTFDIECPVGVKKQTGTTVSWTIDSLTEWSIVPTCWHTNDTGYQCCTTLPVTIYQHPRQVSISFVNHTGPMFEGGDYDLQCSVQDVAPVGDLTVTFYKGQTALGQQQANNNTEKKPVNETFTMSISMTNEDDGAQFWCEAKLELGPEGPQPPPS